MHQLSVSAGTACWVKAEAKYDDGNNDDMLASKDGAAATD